MNRVLYALLLVCSGNAFANLSCTGSVNPTGGSLGGDATGYWTGCLQNVIASNGSITTQSLAYNPTGPTAAHQVWKNAYIAWNIFRPAGEDYLTYQYTFSATSKDLSHMILGLSPEGRDSDGNLVPALTKCSGDPNANCIWDVSSSFDGIASYTATSNGNSNPGLPGTLYGVKFGGTSTTVSVQYNSYRVPVWQNFYAKDGNVNGGTPQREVFAFNAPGFFIVSADTNTWVPDDPPVPEPGFYVVLAGGLVALFFSRRRRDTQKLS